MTAHESPAELAAKIIGWNKKYAAEAKAAKEAQNQTEPWHDERCCMNGAHPGWRPHPDCPGMVAP
jgi:hypothetical protein